MGASALIVFLKASMQIVSQAGIDLIWMGTTSQAIDIMELIHVSKCGDSSLAASFNQESTFALKFIKGACQP